MRRAIARGRIVPQSRSTDPRMGRVSLKAATLYDRMWINADDQGRLSGDPDEIKYTACPNLPDISKEDIPDLLKELAATKPGLIKVYTTSKTEAIQMLDWWEEQRLQWAWPSQYAPPQGWQDRLRYKPTPKEIVTVNWLPPSQLGGALPSEPPNPLPSISADLPADSPPGLLPSSPLTTPIEKQEEKGRGKGRGNTPGAPGGRSPPSLTGLSTDEIEILHELTACFKKEFGRVPAESPYKIIPREPTARESAQLRDLAKELCVAGGCPLDYIDQAFKEAAGQPKEKMRVSYVRAILLDWLGVARGPPR